MIILLTYLAFIIVVLLVFFTGYLQYKYAVVNYPASWRWKFLLFINGFTTGAIGVWLLPFSDITWGKVTLLCLGGGFFHGYCTAFLFPQKMQTMIPKKE